MFRHAETWCSRVHDRCSTEALFCSECQQLTLTLIQTILICQH